MATEKQLTANRANAQLSTGPVTPEGKAASSHNAVKTGLTGQTVLLKTDDVDKYTQHIQHFTDKYKPANEEERTLVQDLADTEWRLARIMPLEAGILALGRIELAPLFAAYDDEPLRAELLEAKVFLVYRKDLNNLSLQQTRLRKHRETVTKGLVELQDRRKTRIFHQTKRASEYFVHALEENWSMELTDFGFDFTLDDMIEQLANHKATVEHDAYPEVTKKVYREDFRAQYLKEFVED